MSHDVFVVACDGRDQTALDFAVKRAKREGACLHIVHVLEWSPYSFLTPQELAERHKHREEELAKANTAVLQPLLEKVRQSGVEVSGEIRHGHVVDVLSAIARERSAAMIFAGRSNSLSDRVFGSVASGLAQSAPVPAVIVP